MMRIKRIVFLFFYLFFNALIGVGLLCGCASDINADTPEARQEAFEDWKKDFKKQAVKAGISRSYLEKTVPEIRLLPMVIAADKRQSEFVSTFWSYTDKSVSKQRINKGREMYLTHRKLAEKTATQYGVPAYFLIAFWGAETNYGSFKGNINTMDALATLAFDKRRRSFFTKELITFMRCAAENNWGTVKGSWAGAFGNFQFMPTTFDVYAVDGDGDGNRDIVNSLPDAFASAANYLSQMGWNPNEPWGVEVQLTKPLDWDKVHAKQTYTVAEWQKMGIKPYQKTGKNLSGVPARLVLPMGVDGPAFLTFKNYDITMRWNRSTLYALSVGLLADSIKDPTFKIHATPTTEQLTRSDIEEIQTLLKSNGYYAGKIDGSVGPKTRQAIRHMQQKMHLPQDGYPTKSFLNKLKGL